MNAPATLLLVRHAAIDCSRDGRTRLCGSFDVALSNKGRRQVELLRQRLAEERDLSAVYASPLTRAIQTADAVPEHLRGSARIVRSLAEIHCGLVEGLYLDDVQTQFADYWLANQAQIDDDFSWPGGETYRDFRHRVLRTVGAIARMHKGQRVLLVTHAGVINQVLGSIIGQSAACWESPRPKNASITGVTWGQDQRSIICFDDCAHLERPPIP